VVKEYFMLFLFFCYSRKIIDLRNRIIHGYDTIADEVIWGIIINHIPILKKEIESILES
jgi:uncharacterized protein with HEPN domain